MNDQGYYDYYDKIFSGKNYKEETEKVLSINYDLTGNLPKRILDVGCGTGTHDFFLTEKECMVVGLDLDLKIIEAAKKKAESFQGIKPKFLCMDVNDLNDKGFDMAISLFNVINYIPTIKDLQNFFQAIHERLKPNCLYIFDCWNGIAAILDNPRIKSSRIDNNGEIIEIITKPETDIFHQKVTVMNHVKVIRKTGENVEFQFNYNQTLWTPMCLTNILQMSGFEVINVSTWMQPNIKAVRDTWKIMFTTKKIG